MEIMSAYAFLICFRETCMYYIVFNDKTLTLYKFANPKLIRISADTFKRVFAPLADSTGFIPLINLGFT